MLLLEDELQNEIIRMAKYFVIDTNVPVMAGKSVSQLDPSELECALACLNFLRSLMSREENRIAVDLDYYIIKEYKDNLEKREHGNGFSNEFLKWTYACIKADESPLTKLNKVGESYLEYPTNELLDKFDPSDKKFIALSNAHPQNPPIVEGSDCKWWGIVDVLESFGIGVIFPCESYIRSKYEQKLGG